jgi:hypothetical protein
MQAHQQMQVGGHDPELQDPRALLPSDDREVLPEIGGAVSIDGRVAITGRPDDTPLHQHPRFQALLRTMNLA